MIHQVSFTGLLLDSVKEIFETMIFMDILESDEPAEPVEGDAILSSITFKGDLEGCLILCCEKTCAQAITMNMLGSDSAEGFTEEDICDATGEVINMVMGGVKKRLYETYSSLELSIPLVIMGRQLKNNLGDGMQEVISHIRIEDEYPAAVSLLYREKK